MQIQRTHWPEPVRPFSTTFSYSYIFLSGTNYELAWIHYETYEETSSIYIYRNIHVHASQDLYMHTIRIPQRFIGKPPSKCVCVQRTQLFSRREILVLTHSALECIIEEVKRRHTYIDIGGCVGAVRLNFYNIVTKSYQHLCGCVCVLLFAIKVFCRTKEFRHDV